MDFRASELARTNQVIAEREKAGLDTTAQKAYLAKINSLDSGKSTGNTTTDSYLAEIKKRAQAGEDVTADVVDEGPVVDEETGEVIAENTQSDAMKEVIALIAENQKNQLEALTAAEEAAFKKEEANLDKAYAQAEADNKVSAAQAETDLASQQALVDENRYAETEAGKVFGENRGIGNSAQFQAMNRGTLSRAGKQKLEAAQMRDATLADLTTRIDNLSLQRDLDVTSAEATKDYNIATGTASLGQQAFNQQLGQIQTEQGYDFQKLMQDDAQTFTGEENALSRSQTASENALSRAQTTVENALNRTLTAEQNDLNRQLTADENALNRALTVSERKAAEKAYNGRIKDANDRADALAYKEKFLNEQAYNSPGSPEWITRTNMEAAELGSYEKKIKIDAANELNSAIMEASAIDSIESAKTDYERMGNDEKDEFQVFYYDAQLVGSGYKSGGENMPDIKLTPEQQIIELDGLRKAVERNAYLQGYDTAKSSLWNYISEIQKGIDNGILANESTKSDSPVFDFAGMNVNDASPEQLEGLLQKIIKERAGN